MTPHPLQRWMMRCSPSGRAAIPVGAIRARQGLDRSPGRRWSTCREVRQNGQWLRWRPPETVCPTIWRQRPQRKGAVSSRRMRGRDRCGTWLRCRRGRGVTAGGKAISSPSSNCCQWPEDRRGTGNIPRSERRVAGSIDGRKQRSWDSSSADASRCRASGTVVSDRSWGGRRAATMGANGIARARGSGPPRRTGTRASQDARLVRESV